MDIKQIKRNLLRLVEYEGHIYTFQECVLWAQDSNGEQQLRYSAVLLDRAGNTIRAPIEAVKETVQ